MDLKRIFGILGIEITKSELAIKRAYQEKVKEIHPEEHPMEWQELYQAYKNALSYAKGHFWFLEEFYAEIGDEAIADKDVEEDIEFDTKSKGSVGESTRFYGEYYEELNGEIDWKSEGKTDQELGGERDWKLEGKIDQELEGEIDRELEEEADVYSSIFTDLYVSGEKTRQENMTQVMRFFDSLVNTYPGAHDWQLIEFLKSPLFRSCWEEELVLYYLKRALNQVKDSHIASQIREVLEELIEHLAGTMETSKISQVEEMLVAIRKKEGRRKNKKNSQGEFPYKDGTSRKQAFKWRIGIGTATFIGFLIFILISTLLDTDDFILSESEAKNLIVIHLEEKYGLEGLRAEDITLMRHTIHWTQPSMQIGFRGGVGRGNTGDVRVIAWEEDGQMITYIFDNFQVAEISKDLGESLLGALNLPEGELFLSSSQNMRERTFLTSNWAGFHTYYTGDLKAFFEEEARIRSRIIAGLFPREGAPGGTMEEAMQHVALELFTNIDTSIFASSLEVGLNLNGRATLYIRDPMIETMTDRLMSTDGSHLEMLEEVLAIKAQTYHIQILALVLPQSYYDEVLLTASVDERLRNNVLSSVGGSSIREGRAPISASVLTGWYHSADERFSNQLFTRNAWKIEDGIFVITEEGEEWTNSLVLEKSELLDDVEEHLHSNGVIFNHSISFELSSDSNELRILILDIKQLDILATSFTIADVCLDSDGGVENVRLLNFATTIRESMSSPSNSTVVEGYLIIPLRLSFAQGRVITIVY